jgi:hypothetical protein
LLHVEMLDCCLIYHFYQLVKYEWYLSIWPKILSALVTKVLTYMAEDQHWNSIHISRTLSQIVDVTDVLLLTFRDSEVSWYLSRLVFKIRTLSLGSVCLELDGENFYMHSSRTMRSELKG